MVVIIPVIHKLCTFYPELLKKTLLDFEDILGNDMAKEYDRSGTYYSGFLETSGIEIQIKPELHKYQVWFTFALRRT